MTKTVHRFLEEKWLHVALMILAAGGLTAQPIAPGSAHQPIGRQPGQPEGQNAPCHGSPASCCSDWLGVLRCSPGNDTSGERSLLVLLRT